MHRITVQNVHSAFRRHKDRFVEGKHFYLVENEGIRLEHNGTPKTNYLFTEKGYLLLTKPLRDTKAWEVQERMIDDYFTIKGAAQPTFYNPQTQMLIETLTRLDAYEARQAEQQAALVAVQAQTIETQRLALTALQAQQWITIRQYVMSHRLAHQCTLSDQQAYAKWLGTHCLEIGMPMYKAFTADVSWPDERTYHAGTINATLPGWLARRHAQPALAIVKETP